jgi:hypothetical protein
MPFAAMDDLARHSAGGVAAAWAAASTVPLPAIGLCLAWGVSAFAQEMTTVSATVPVVDPSVEALARILGSGGLPAVAMAAIVLLRGWVPTFRIEHVHRIDASDRDEIRSAVEAALDRRESTDTRLRRP